MVEVRKVFLRSSVSEYRLEYAFVIKDEHREFAFSPWPEGVGLENVLITQGTFKQDVPEKWLISEISTGDPCWIAAAPHWVGVNCFTYDPKNDPINDVFTLDRQLNFWNSGRGTVVPVTMFPALKSLEDHLVQYGNDFASRYIKNQGINSIEFELRFNSDTVISVPVYRNGTYEDSIGFYLPINGHLYAKAIGKKPCIEATVVDLETGEVLESFRSFRGATRNLRLDDALIRGYLKAAIRSLEYNYYAPTAPGQWEQRRKYEDFKRRTGINYVELCDAGRNLECIIVNK